MAAAIETFTTVNLDESLVSEAVPALLPPGRISQDLAERRHHWLERFQREIYGIVPPSPDSISIARHPIAGEKAERLALTMEIAGRRLTVDAALWLPADRSGPVPIVLGLDFLGPIGNFFGNGFPLDEMARIPRSSGGRLSESQRGTTGYRWPAEMITEAGFAVLTSCYGSWVPDSDVEWRDRGVWPLFKPGGTASQPGAIALWAWAISRLVDAAALLPEVDGSKIAAAGHSRLGKAALLAMATDTRITAGLINNSGCLGASLSSRNFGETVDELKARFPHWTSPNPVPASADDDLDQHHLLASVAPRQLYVASASEDLWCDPKGEYLALAAAAPAWNEALPPLADTFVEGTGVRAGAIGWHLRQGPHDIRPYDWARFLAFMDAPSSGWTT